MVQKNEQEREDIKFFVRVMNTDLDGKKSLVQAMQKIKGIGFSYASMVCSVAGINPSLKAGLLSDAQITKLEYVIKDPLKYNVPAFMLNRRKDYETGNDMHLLTADVDYMVGNDIKRLKMIRCYKGMRHAFGLPVRGQRTKSNFRKNKGKVKIAIKKKADKTSGRV
jgi:small subunit ribosomal protein S13